MWCAFFYFIKCKANTVSAKSVQSSSLESQITGFLLYVYIQYIHKILPSNFLAASLSTVMTSRRQLKYHIGTAQPPNWRHWQIVCTTSMAVLCECETFRHRKFYVRVLTDNQEKGHCTLVYKCFVSENFCFSFCVLLSPSSLRKQ